ncbi:hypothetical protein CYMTET_12788 [Cymbomonas tetramitiformis]|uniref:Uncharacterized protein n=1 Tax=Cymbomonas tetramitiformis TaxID=36881 RepID=A0AAE0GJZ6_9CHLO|nr:hypothetical protein CYMTET_12788 [Cymbomonas tetramitiformis]
MIAHNQLKPASPASRLKPAQAGQFSKGSCGLELPFENWPACAGLIEPAGRTGRLELVVGDHIDGQSRNACLINTS